mgnify:CR=1 FL=1|jgi:Na+/H+ antiporter NhaC|tara:strand:+ start:5168 stop:5410 length:243 start_codon:yes stop_codon:yes gene_type:complete
MINYFKKNILLIFILILLIVIIINQLQLKKQITKVKEDILVHKEMSDKGLAIKDKEIRDIIIDLIKRNLDNKDLIEMENK